MSVCPYFYSIILKPNWLVGPQRMQPMKKYGFGEFFSKSSKISLNSIALPDFKTCLNFHRHFRSFSDFSNFYVKTLLFKFLRLFLFFFTTNFNQIYKKDFRFGDACGESRD